MSIREITEKKRYPHIFILAYTLLSFIAVFRFGQIGDYFSYERMYDSPEEILEVDPLFGNIILLCKSCGIKYEYFMLLLNAICMLLCYPFFYKTCNCSFVSLLTFYSYGFLMCPMQATRQGICLALLLFSYSFLSRGKKKFFFICVLIGSFIHLSFVFALFIPWIIKRHFFNDRWIFIAILIFTIVAFIGNFIGTIFIGYMGERVTYYGVNEEHNVTFQIILRLLILLPILIQKPQYESDGYNAKAICVFGYLLYCVLCFSLLVAGRIEYYYRTFVCLFVAYIISNNYRRRIDKYVITGLLIIHIFLWFKNIDAAIERGYYKEGVTAYNFPYISIFDKAELSEYSDMNTDGYN